MLDEHMKEEDDEGEEEGSDDASPMNVADAADDDEDEDENDPVADLNLVQDGVGAITLNKSSSKENLVDSHKVSDEVVQPNQHKFHVPKPTSSNS